MILGIVGVAAIGGGSALCVLAGKKSNAPPQLALGGISIAGGGVLFLSGMVGFGTVARRRKEDASAAA